MAEGLVEDLRAQIHRGQAVVVAGAGVAAGASGGMAEASWHGLLESGVAWCQRRLPALPAGWAEVVLGLVQLGDASSLVSAAELVTEKLGGRQGGEYRRWLRETLASLATADPSVPEALGNLGVPIATTNYDGLIEAANDGLGTVTWRDGAGIQRILRGDGRAVVHLHGYWDDPESVVLGIRSYEAVLGDAAAQALQQAIASISTLIFVGVGSGADDPNFGALRSWLARTFSGSEYRHFRLCRESEVEALVAEHKGERIVPLAYGEDFGDLAPFLRRLIPRTQPRLRQTIPVPAKRITRPKIARGREGTITVADSGLVVIKSILLAWGLDQFVDALGYDVEYVNEPWSTSVLDAIASGHLGMAIFNQERSLEYETTHRSYLRILGIFGHSMGGRNFCILAHREGRWAGVSADEFLQAPRDARICVGLGTDRFQNLLQAFGRTEPELTRQGVTFINISEPSLDVFLNDRDILLVGGQNTRFEAVISGEYLELVRYESLPDDRRGWFRRSAANALVISEDLNAKLLRSGVRDLYPSLKREFFGNWQDPRSFSELLDCIIRDCEFACSDPGDRERIARHILYETYRIGEPVW